MKYQVLSSIEYYKGRAFLVCSKFSFDSVLMRKIMEWASSKSSSDAISVLVVSGIGGSVNLSDLNSPRNVIFSTGGIEDLSDLDYLKNFSCIVMQSVNNDKISPVIRKTIENYVENGGGLVVSDLKIDADYVSLFETIGPVYCQSSSFLISSGAYVWTDEGRENYIYEPEFSAVNIFATSTVAEVGLGSYWKQLYVYDTASSGGVDIEVVGSVYSSVDYDIPGAVFMGYSPSVYKNGIFSLET